MPKLLPITAIPLPIPWPPGPVLVYLVRQDPVTLIDTGLHDQPSWEALADGLRTLGLTVKDIRRILITHAHLDHYGQAARLQAESGAEVFMHPDEAGKVDSPDWWLEGRQLALDDAGAPAELQHQMNRFWERGRGLTLPLTDWRPLRDGDRIAFDGGELEAVHLPGHALGHTGFWERKSGILIGGDHLLDGVTPNPILEPLPPGRDSGTRHAPGRALTLGQFLSSLERAIAMPLSQVYPGHGPVITDHGALARSYIAKHQRRLDTLWQRIAGGATAYALTREFYPRVREFDIFLALSEVLAHLDLLAVQGRATVEAGDSVLFRAV
ncbi:MAG TPA: MBL fold metallo-hydrolase [Symbiobacteriaceae bacterium]|jgi:glyoxylase-like metal-dependent hydrolase (beta-lactamase superfamily II)